MKVKDLHIYGTKARLVALKEEYDWVGRNATRWAEDGHLVILALPPVKPKKKKKQKKSETDETVERPRRRSNGHHRVKRFD